MRTPRDAFDQVPSSSNMSCSHAVLHTPSSKHSHVKMEELKNGESDSEANSDGSFERELSQMERKIHLSVIGSSHVRDMMDESASSSDVKLMNKSDQEIRSNQDLSIGNCSTSGKQSSKEELNRCYKNVYNRPSHKISKTFLPHWVYRMYDSYWLAQRAAGSFALLLQTLSRYFLGVHFFFFIVMISLLLVD